MMDLWKTLDRLERLIQKWVLKRSRGKQDYSTGVRTLSEQELDWRESETENEWWKAAAISNIYFHEMSPQPQIRNFFKMGRGCILNIFYSQLLESGLIYNCARMIAWMVGKDHMRKM